MHKDTFKNRLNRNYLRNIATNDETTKRILTTIVRINRNFSKPRLVLYSPPPSPPPNAPPTPALDCCSKIAAIKIIDKIICK